MAEEGWARLRVCHGAKYRWTPLLVVCTIYLPVGVLGRKAKTKRKRERVGKEKSKHSMRAGPAVLKKEREKKIVKWEESNR